MEGGFPNALALANMSQRMRFAAFIAKTIVK